MVVMPSTYKTSIEQKLNMKLTIIILNVFLVIPGSRGNGATYYQENEMELSLTCNFTFFLRILYYSLTFKVLLPASLLELIIFNTFWSEARVEVGGGGIRVSLPADHLDTGIATG